MVEEPPETASGGPDTDLVLDAKLESLRLQMGEIAWADRITVACERQAVVRDIQRLRSAGHSWKETSAAVATTVTESTMRAWVSRYEDEGLVGLIDRTGRLTVFREDAPQRPAPVSRRGRQARSFVKWVGGKRGCIRELVVRMQRPQGTYYEPMAGSGIVFFALAPERAVLSDVNAELVESYRVVRDDVEALIAALGRHRNTQAHYHHVRAQPPEDLSPVERAARFIFLNKTCYNGLYRVNRHGRFNVPYGRIGHANFQDSATLRWASQRLSGVTLRCGDYVDAVSGAGPGDLVYLDPPYLAPSTRLIRYRASAFSEEDHRTLAGLFRHLDRRGCRVVLSNADVPMVRELYDGYAIDRIQTRRPVNRNATERKSWTELLVRNFDDLWPNAVPSWKRHGDQLPLRLG